MTVIGAKFVALDCSVPYEVQDVCELYNPTALLLSEDGPGRTRPLQNCLWYIVMKIQAVDKKWKWTVTQWKIIEIEQQISQTAHTTVRRHKVNDSHRVKRVQCTRRRKLNVNDEDSSHTRWEQEKTRCWRRVPQHKRVTTTTTKWVTNKKE